MYEVVFFHEKIKKIDMGKGVVRQDFASGKNMNVLHWNMSNESEVGMHTHPQEQFGYVIKGGFHLTIGEETFELKAGDAGIFPLPSRITLLQQVLLLPKHIVPLNLILVGHPLMPQKPKNKWNALKVHYDTF